MNHGESFCSIHDLLVLVLVLSKFLRQSILRSSRNLCIIVLLLLLLRIEKNFACHRKLFIAIQGRDIVLGRLRKDLVTIVRIRIKYCSEI